MAAKFCARPSTAKSKRAVRDAAELAGEMIAHTVEKHRIAPGTLVLHADGTSNSSDFSRASNPRANHRGNATEWPPCNMQSRNSLIPYFIRYCFQHE
jgi:hypothetical protein